jgi:hypothetical protein
MKSLFVAGSLCLAFSLNAQQSQPWVAGQTAGDLVYLGGKIGIGLNNPSQPLEVNGNVRSTPTTGSFSVGGAAPAGYQFFATSATGGVASALQLHSSYSSASTSFIGNFGDYGLILSQNREPQVGGFVDNAASPNQARAAGILLGDANRGRLFELANYPGGSETVRLLVDYSGHVGIGTLNPSPSALLDVNGDVSVAGNITMGGNINAKYQDVAEWVPASEQMAPGTVVVLNIDKNNEVLPSSRPYDIAVAGVVSASPGVLLGTASASKAMIATTGRVKVHVDASSAAIHVGDLLVTSSKTGMAMKSEPFDVGGLKIHRPGTLIGKALEPLSSGSGDILVLLSLQ